MIKIAARLRTVAYVVGLIASVADLIFAVLWILGKLGVNTHAMFMLLGTEVGASLVAVQIWFADRIEAVSISLKVGEYIILLVAMLLGYIGYRIFTRSLAKANRAYEAAKRQVDRVGAETERKDEEEVPSDDSGPFLT